MGEEGDVAQKQSVDGSGAPPHIQSLTLFIQPLKSNQEKYSLFVRFARQRGRSLPQPSRDQRSARAAGHRTGPVKGPFVPCLKRNEGFQNL